MAFYKVEPFDLSHLTTTTIFIQIWSIIRLAPATWQILRTSVYRTWNKQDLTLGFTLSLARARDHGCIYCWFDRAQDFYYLGPSSHFPRAIPTVMLPALVNLTVPWTPTADHATNLHIPFPLQKCNLRYFLLPPWWSSINHHLSPSTFPDPQPTWSLLPLT